MIVVLNIGLNVGTTGQLLPAGGVAVRVEHNTGELLQLHIKTMQHAHGYEQTLCLKVRSAYGVSGTRDAVAHLSDALLQDCIAVFFPTLNFGELLGSKAESWGTFNPDYFEFLGEQSPSFIVAP